MKQRYHRRYDKGEVKHAFLIGALSAIIFAVTAFGANVLFQKSANEIGDHYKMVRVKADEKMERKPARSRTKYYIRGTAENGYEGIFWVSRKLYKKLETGDWFFVYQYKNSYSSTLPGLIRENAGAAHTVLYLAAIMALPMSVIFAGIGIVQKIKGRQKRRKDIKSTYKRIRT